MTPSKHTSSSLLVLSFFLLFHFSLAQNTTLDRKYWIYNQVSQANAFITNCSHLDHKYQDMSTSAFAFFRATAYLYYLDLSGAILIPDAWVKQPYTNIWLSGDYHVQNIGYFDDNEGTVVFDLNDADDSYIGPFYWDLIRFSTSVYLMTSEITSFSVSLDDQSALVSGFLQSYQDTLESVYGNPDEMTIEMNDKYIKNGFIRDQLEKLKKKKTQVDLLNKYTVINVNGSRRFDWDNPKLVNPTYLEKDNIKTYFPYYLNTLDRTWVEKVGNDTYFVIKDIAVRIDSGLGSQGVDKYYVLIEGLTSSQDDDELLEVKEEGYPSLSKTWSSWDKQTYDGRFYSNAQRVVIAKHALGIKVDNHLGSMTFEKKDYKVTHISPYKFGFESIDFGSLSDVEDLVLYAAKALALSHARSDKDYDNGNYINYNFEKEYFNATKSLPKFKTHVNDLSAMYFEQVGVDYYMFLDLYNTKRFQCNNS